MNAALPRRAPVGVRARLARPARRARRPRARSRSRSATACPELLARVLAGRGVEADDGRGLPRSDRAAADARPGRADRHAEGGVTHRRRDRAPREDRDLRRLRRRRRDLGGAAGAVPAPCRHRAADPHPRPPLRGLRAERRGGPRARREAARRCSSPSIAAPPASSRSPRRSSSASTWSSSTITRPTRRCRRRDALVNPNRLDDLSRLGHLAAVGARVHDRGRGQPRAAQARLLDARRGRSRTCSTCSISWRSAPSPTWCR